MRALYRLAEMPGLLDRRDVAVIGDGPSKLKYIFRRRDVYTFAINRAAIDYPCDFAVCIPQHLDQMLGVLPDYVPLIYINNFDLQDLQMPVGGVWTATIFLRWLFSWASEEQSVYLQGFDFTSGINRYDGSKNEYEIQAVQFERLFRDERRCRVVKMEENEHLNFIETARPPVGKIL